MPEATRVLCRFPSFPAWRVAIGTDQGIQSHGSEDPKDSIMATKPTPAPATLTVNAKVIGAAKRIIRADSEPTDAKGRDRALGVVIAIINEPIPGSDRVTIWQALSSAKGRIPAKREPTGDKLVDAAMAEADRVIVAAHAIAARVRGVVRQG